MDNSSAIYIAVALAGTGLMGAAFARWRRALSDWRKVVAGIPGMRRVTFLEFRRFVTFAGVVALVLRVWAKQHTEVALLGGF